MNLKNPEEISLCCAAPIADAPGDLNCDPLFSVVKNPDLRGILHHYPSLASQYIKPRNVEIWLPPDYHETETRRYPVIYMHDGQNLFEPEKSYIGVDWGMDEALTALTESKQVSGAMVVAVWNTPQRLREYLPQKPFDPPLTQRLKRRLIRHYGGMPVSDNYLRFLVYELKPMVDRCYRTRPGRESTLVMGSSMGGLISLYAICEYPWIFGGAGCLSPHWPIAHWSFSKYLQAWLPEAGGHKIYLDYGNEIHFAGYRFNQKQVESIFEGKRYRLKLDWQTLWYKGDPHSETAWRARVPVPLRFLLNRRQGPRRIAGSESVKGGARASETDRFDL